MKKRFLKTIIITLFVLVIQCSSVTIAYASESNTSKNEDWEQLIDNLDLSALDEYLLHIEKESGDIVGLNSADFIKNIVSGEKTVDLKIVFDAFLCGLSRSGGILSVAGMLIVICIVWSISAGIEFKNNTNSAKKAVNLACLCTMSIIVLYWIYSIVSSVAAYFGDLKALCDAVFPIFFTLLFASGAATTVTALSPVAAFLSYGMVYLIIGVVLPIAIALLVLAVVGNMSSDLPLNSFSAFLRSCAEGIMRIGFYIVAAFLGAQGIFSGIKDSVSLRLGKFALSKYVPIIGGYLSDGINYVVAGSVVIKNAVGITAVFLVILRLLPILISLLVASLTLKFVSLIAEPLGVKTVVAVFKQIDECLKLLRAAAVGSTFLIIIFIGAVMMCGGSVL